MYNDLSSEKDLLDDPKASPVIELAQDRISSLGIALIVSIEKLSPLREIQAPGLASDLAYILQ